MIKKSWTDPFVSRIVNLHAWQQTSRPASDLDSHPSTQVAQPITLLAEEDFYLNVIGWFLGLNIEG